MNWIYFWLRSVLADGQVLQRSGNRFVGVAPDALALADNVEPASNNAYDLGVTGTRWRTGYFGTSIDAPKWTYAGAGEIDLTGASTRTLTVRNSTSSQVANVDLDGTYYFRNGTAFTAQILCTPTANRVITFPDASITVASLAGAETLTNKTLTAPKADKVQDTAGANALELSATASAVNGLVLTNAATGVYVQTAPGGTGSDTNASWRLRGKGTGSVCLVNGANSAIRVEVNDTGLGFFGATPVAQQAAQAALTTAGPGSFVDGAEPTGAEVAAAVNIAINRCNEISVALRNLGLIAT